MECKKTKPHKGRGAVSNPDCRYHQQTRQLIDDGWQADEQHSKPRTTIHRDDTKTILNKVTSPDIPFGVTINPYRGCEHGCIYCYARPTHAYLDMSPGLDFETQLVIKPDAPRLLRTALAKKNYQCQTIALGSNTDPYQPIEREYRITRQILEILSEHHHPVTIVTKSALIERDIDILSEMAKRHLVQVMVSITTLDKVLARKMEPRASTPARRLEAIQRLSAAGIPTGVMTAPVIPVLNDPEMESILEQAAKVGANTAGYVLLRLPLEVAPLFEQWLHEHYPLKAEHVLTRIRDTRQGKLYQAKFGQRMQGNGAFAAIIGHRFQKACQRFGIAKRALSLDTRQFSVKQPTSAQMLLF